MDTAAELHSLATRIADGQAAQRERTSLIVALDAAGWSQQRIAEAAGISQQAVSKILTRATSRIFIRVGVRAELAAGANPRDSLAKWRALATPDTPDAAATLAEYLEDFEAVIEEEVAAAAAAR